MEKGRESVTGSSGRDGRDGVCGSEETKASENEPLRKSGLGQTDRHGSTGEDLPGRIRRRAAQVRDGVGFPRPRQRGRIFPELRRATTAFRLGSYGKNNFAL